MVSGPSTVASGPHSAKFFPFQVQTSSYATDENIWTRTVVPNLWWTHQFEHASPELEGRFNSQSVIPNIWKTVGPTCDGLNGNEIFWKTPHRLIKNPRFEQKKTGRKIYKIRLFLLSRHQWVTKSTSEYRSLLMTCKNKYFIDKKQISRLAQRQQEGTSAHIQDSSYFMESFSFFSSRMSNSSQVA